jgi:hypothetical protein
MHRKHPVTSHKNRRTTRYEPPILAEAVLAAQSLSDDIECQVEITAGLIGLSEEEVRPAVLKAARSGNPSPAPRSLGSARSIGTRVVVVERRTSRLASR